MSFAVRRVLLFAVCTGLAATGLATAVPRQADAAVAAFTQVASGGAHTCAISAGYVWCWGDNSRGQLGSRTPGDSSPFPVPVDSITSATRLAAGANHTCALLADGTVWCWGAGNVGQLGNGSPQDTWAPTQVSGVSGATFLTAGRAHTCASAAGGLSCWGSNGAGQLGVGAAQDAPWTLESVSNGQLIGANSIASGADGSFLVSDTAAGKVSLYEARGFLQTAWSGLASPSFTAVAGSAYYAAAGTQVFRLTPGQAPQLYVTMASRVSGLTGDPAGNVYVATAGASPSLIKYGPAGSVVWSQPSASTELSNVSDLAYVSAGGGRIYAADSGHGFQVTRIAAGNGARLGLMSVKPPGTSQTPNGNCAITNSAGNVQAFGGMRIGTDGSNRLLVSLHNVTHPREVQNDEGDWVFVGFGGGCIDVYDQTSGDYMGNYQAPFGDTDSFDNQANAVTGSTNGRLIVADTGGNRVVSLVPGADSDWRRDFGWGGLSFSMTPRPVNGVPAGGVTNVQAGGDHTCEVIDLVGYCWGSNAALELGAPASVDSTSHPRVTFPAARQVAPGAQHICAIHDSATVACFGGNSSGQKRGEGQPSTFSLTQPGAPSPSTLTNISSGAQLSCVRTNSGRIACWGAEGLRGDLCGLLADSCTPEWVLSDDPAINDVSGVMTSMTDVSVSTDHTCSVSSFLGRVFCWGRPDAQGLGLWRPFDGDMAAEVPLLPPGATEVTAGAGMGDAISVNFNTGTSGVATDNLLLTSAGQPQAPVGHTLTCLGVDSEQIDCESGPVWSAELLPHEPLALGGAYQVTVNPVGVSAITVAGVEFPSGSYDVTLPSRVSETGAGATYSWPNKRSSKALGGSYVWSDTPGSSASYDFNGRGVTWYTTTGPKQGVAVVRVDGKKVDTVDLKAKKTKTKVAKSFNGLGAGDHVLTVEVASSSPSGRSVVVDGFKARGGRDDSPRLVTAWATVQAKSAEDGRYLTSESKGSALTLTFEGNELKWQTREGQQFGDAQIKVDGKKFKTVSLYSRREKAVTVKIGGLGGGSHKVTITVVGTGAGSRDEVAVDGFVTQAATP